MYSLRTGRHIVRLALRQTGNLGKRFYSYETAYAEKIRQRSLQTGLSVEELRLKAQEKLKEEHRAAAASLPSFKPQETPSTVDKSATRPQTRKDSSPIKPLSDILRLARLATATPEQVSALWTAYHASRSEGTGRGYLCAAIPVHLYTKMAKIGETYPSFVVPLPRPDMEDLEKTNHEFFYMEWGFHHSPPVPSPNEDPFATKSPSQSPNPRISTVLFTPLQEYKLRNSSATPYLTLTHYTDLVESHGIVLLRGEISPTVAGVSGEARFMLSQEDAQQLAMGIQKFYLWGEKDGEVEGERLLTTFHSKPEEFSWQDLLKAYNKTI
ncbi:ATP11-domain-containing protein [Hymenopellis radicata]|nr:ATP11-domain-containing protein [Hymenopellis radicata]